MALFSYEKKQSLPLLRELAVDFEAGQPVIGPEGDFLQVTGLEAARVWVWRALRGDNTRFVWSAHTERYGHQFHLLDGRPLPEAESRLIAMVREALLVCPYITGVERFSFTREGARLTAAFTVRTVYGTMTAESEARI